MVKIHSIWLCWQEDLTPKEKDRKEKRKKKNKKKQCQDKLGLIFTGKNQASIKGPRSKILQPSMKMSYIFGERKRNY